MSDVRRFTRLLEAGRIGNIRIKNRMVRTAAGTDFIAPGGMPKSRQEAPFYEALARGGVGLIIVGAASVDHPLPTASPVQLKLDDDRQIPEFRKITDIAHRHDCPIFMQFFHPGAWRSAADGIQPLSASAIPLEELQARGPEFTVSPRELTVPEIKEIQDAFVAAAARARRAGFDGIEINAATCHLANSFLSRAWNRRGDAYGCQSLENRARFVVETKEAIRQQLGPEVPVGILINGGEFGIEDGLTPEETREFASIFERAGFDYISVRAFGYMKYFDLHLPDSIYFPEPPRPLAAPLDGSRHGAGVTVPLAAAVKQAVSIPVITVGKIDAELGEAILQQGKADFIGLGRPLIADPEFPNKVASGKIEDIVPCTYCLSCFGFVVDRGEDTHCRINAAVGGEEDYAVPPAEKKKRVVVIGGGPSGMEAARVAALRGHEVILAEREPRLGGLLPLAAVVKGPEVEDLEKITRYFRRRLDKLGVTVRLGEALSPAAIERIQPDVVIAATGGRPDLPEIPGVNLPIVLGMPALYRRLKRYLRLLGPRALRFLSRCYLPVGKRVIVTGGGIQGGELVEFLVKRGRRVIWVDTAATMEDDRLPRARTLRLFRWLAEKDVTIMNGVRYRAITDKGLDIVTAGGREETLEADTIIPVTPLAADNTLSDNLKGKVPEVYTTGDAAAPGLILDAIAAGYRIAREI